jgi:hypothetical protein
MSEDKILAKAFELYPDVLTRSSCAYDDDFMQSCEHLRQAFIRGAKFSEEERACSNSEYESLKAELNAANAGWDTEANLSSSRFEDISIFEIVIKDTLKVLKDRSPTASELRSSVNFIEHAMSLIADKTLNAGDDE